MPDLKAMFPLAKDDKQDFMTWKKELHLCYIAVPKYMFPHWYTPDTLEQVNVKKAAAMVAFEYLKDSDNVLNGQLKLFCYCLPSFHAITVHLKCNKFDLKHKACISASCPLGTGGRMWRSHHKLNFIKKDSLCTKKNRGLIAPSSCI